MPEDAAFSIGEGGFFGCFECFFYGEVLVVGAEDLFVVWGVFCVAEEVLEDVEEPVFFEHSFEENVECGVLGVFIVSIDCFPFHVPIFGGGDGPGF